MPEPTTVWFVRAGSVEASAGRIALEGGHLLFTPRGKPEPLLRIPVSGIHDARRLRGSAVLQVDAAEEEGPLLFYFTMPPPLGREAPSLINPRRGLERTFAGMSLRAAAREKRPVIDAWVRAIRTGTAD